MELTWIDYTVAGILVIFTFWGAFTGLIKGLFNIGAWVAGLAGAWFLSAPATALLLSNVAGIHPMGLKIAASAVIFLVFFGVTKIIGTTFNNMIKKSALNSLNRVGGAGIGFIKALILSILLLAVITLLPVKGALYQAKTHSMTWNFYHQHLHSASWEQIP